MAITVTMFGVGLLQMLDTPIDIEAGTHKLALATSSYTPDRDTHDFFNDITNELSTADGYTAVHRRGGIVALRDRLHRHGRRLVDRSGVPAVRLGHDGQPGPGRLQLDDRRGWHRLH